MLSQNFSISGSRCGRLAFILNEVFGRFMVFLISRVAGTGAPWKSFNDTLILSRRHAARRRVLDCDGGMDLEIFSRLVNYGRGTGDRLQIEWKNSDPLASLNNAIWCLSPASQSATATAGLFPWPEKAAASGRKQGASKLPHSKAGLLTALHWS